MPALGHVVGLIQMFHAFQISYIYKVRGVKDTSVKSTKTQGCVNTARHASISVILDFVIASFCAQQ